MITFKNASYLPKGFTGVCRFFENDTIHYYLNGGHHREDGPAVEWGISKLFESQPNNQFYYKGRYYGFYFIEEWKEKVKELKYLESLEIFK